MAFSDASIEQMREYAEQVKAAGFDQNITTEDQEVMGMVIYSFSASNAEMCIRDSLQVCEMLAL